VATRSDRSRESARVRRVRRVSAPIPWFPWGWALLATFGGLLFFALVPASYGWIERTTDRTARRALSRIGASWAEVETSGQWVTLRGTPPSPKAAEQARQVVEDARAQTWLGSFVPATWVREAWTEADAEPVVAAEPALGWSFRLEEGVLELHGEVPDAATREALEAKARASLAPPRVHDVLDRLVVVDREAPVGFLEVAERGVTTVAQCDRGVAEFSCDRYSLLCELPESRAAAVRTAAAAPLPYGRVGSVQVLANEAVESCEQALADVLSRSTIRFATESDEIDAGSAPVLDAVAAAARECPGTLRIEGHSDNTGDPAFNDDLSQRRAGAVRRALVGRGLPPHRLVARGYGARRPVADNRTPAGRSRNRRIEIRVVRASD